MLRIWGRTNSVNVKKALWCIEELKLPYERIDAGMVFGVVPTVDDDGFILWESHAIVRYLAAKHGAGSLWPTDLRVRADADRWMDWATAFQTALRAVFWGLIRTPPEKRDLAAIEEGKQRSAELAALFDGALAGKQYVAGSAFTMGDIPIGCHMQVWLRMDIPRPSLPNLEAWFKRLESRAAFKKVVDLPLS
jgi:glutathione S-transferase